MGDPPLPSELYEIDGIVELAATLPVGFEAIK